MSEASNTSAGAAQAPAARKPARLFMKQANMLRVVYCLVPVVILGVYFFGWRALALLGVCTAGGMITEGIMSRRRGQPISMACFVTCMLYSLSLPPTTSFGIALVGIVVALLFGKEVFGGFGRNFANPALVGRAFVYVCFPNQLTAAFVPAFKGLPGGFAHWSFEGLGQLPAYIRQLPDYAAVTGRSVTDAVSMASPVWVYREYGDAVTGQASWWELFMGNIGGVFHADGHARILSAGSIGEGCALLIVLAGIYLLVTRTANWRLMLAGLAGVVAANVLFRNLLGFDGAGEVPPLHLTLFGGTTLYVIVFMITDPVSAPKKAGAMLAYGAMIGLLIVTLRWLNAFVAAATFAVLLGNLLSPQLDMAATWWQKRRKATAAAPAEETG